jgi:trans-aconitate 2-methyltransferase
VDVTRPLAVDMPSAEGIISFLCAMSDQRVRSVHPERTVMSAWNPSQYLQFGQERTRPAVDLVSAIALESPASVIDLGCGPGNSTAALRQRWPAAQVVGLDSSAEMIEAARAAHPDWEWIVSDIANWHPAHPFDVVFSNAALQWVPDHGPLVQRLFGYVAAGGALAFQIPSARHALVRMLIQEIAREEPWASRMAAPLAALTMEPPGFYYDRLAPLARRIDLWESEYLHVMTSHAAIVEWYSSTGLRPFLEALATEAERRRFVARLFDRVQQAYQVQGDGKLLFPFKRTFVVAYA